MNSKEIIEYNERCANFLNYKFSQNYENFDDYYSEWVKMDDGVWYKDEDFVKKQNSSIYYVKVDGVVLKKYNYLLKFDSDWNWIMEIVEAIEKLGLNFKIGSYWITIETIESEIMWKSLNIPHSQLTDDFNKKEAVINAINQFLIWYKKQIK